MTDESGDKKGSAADLPRAERAKEFSRLLDEMQRAADALPDEAKRGYRRERWPPVTVAEMHADFTAAERLEMLQLLLTDYVHDASGRRILDGIIKTMNREQDGS